jgi:hypothetical protein
MSNMIAVSSQGSKKLTTPQILKGGLYITWAASALFLIMTISGIQGQRKAIQTVRKDSTLSIISAQNLKEALAGMDANIANELLAPAGQNQEAFQGYQEQYNTTANNLVTAASNITYGDLEIKPITTVQIELGNYITKIQQARDFHARKDANLALVAYRQATVIMDKKLLPAIDELNQVNVKALEDTYLQERSSVNNSVVYIFLTGGILVTVLISLQLFLSYKMRRTFNPLLLTVTGISVVFLIHTLGSFSHAVNKLKVAKEDAFTSMYALQQAKAFAYIANAAESRYLLDKTFAAQHEKTYFEYIGKIAQPPQGKTYDDVITELINGKSAESMGEFTGFLAEGLKNITFQGEREALLENLKALTAYVKIDQRIRQLERSGKHQEALALCIGTKPGQSNWAFEQLRNANTATYNINEQAFKNAIKDAEESVAGFEVKISVAVVGVAILTLLGLMPRLKEYSS